MPRYSLRTLLIVITVASLCFGWIGTSFRNVVQRRPYFSRFNDGNYPLRCVALFPTDGGAAISRPAIPLLRRIMGDGAVPTLMYQPSADPSGQELRNVRQLFPEATIWGWPHYNDALPQGVNRLPDDIRILI